MTNKQQVVLVLGAGVSGLRCAINVARQTRHQPEVKVILVDRNPYQILQSTLYNVVDQTVPLNKICLRIPEFLKKKNVEFWQDIVTEIDPVNQKVSFHNHETTRYDYLVLALGSQPHDYGIIGLMDHAFLFHNFEQAVRLRKTLHAMLRPGKKIKVIIGGGGPVGVELAGALADLKKFRSHLHIDIIEQASHILGGLPRVLVDQVSAKLKNFGVEIYANQAISKVKNDKVILADGQAIPYDIFIWTGGVKANALVSQAGFDLDSKGRAIVRPTLQARGFARVYLVGDDAAFPINAKQNLPQLAPHARKECHIASDNIVRQINGRSPKIFHPGHYPILICLGQSIGYLIMGPLVFWGRRFVWVRHLVNAYYIHFDFS